MITRPAIPSDAYLLQLRPEDAREVSEGWREKVAESIRQGNTYAALEGGELLALFGIQPGPGVLGPWLLCARGIRRHQRELMRRARRVVHALRQSAQAGTLVYNYIPKDSHGNRRFVERLGFVILPAPGDGQDLFFLPPHV